MSDSKEGLYTKAVKVLGADATPLSDKYLTQRDQDFHFVMGCNGYFMSENGEWKFNPETIRPFIDEFAGQRVSFFGPGPFDSFYSFDEVGYHRFIPAFDQQPVIKAIRKYRGIDEDQAARIAFLFGGIVRQWARSHKHSDNIAEAVRFTANMTSLGERRSGDAIASAMAMYAISGGPLEENNEFTRDVYHMAEAIKDDPVVCCETADLGLSQVNRLHNFSQNTQLRGFNPLPNIAESQRAFEGFPTVGAEFHFPSFDPCRFPRFWQRLAILNMSQYQKDSYIQLSRNDRDVIEVRMNPSVYPITIANWNHMRLLLPELQQTFFTITINRSEEIDFCWGDKGEKTLLNRLRTIGMLNYAGVFEKIPRRGQQEQIGFGEVYLGQTVKMDRGDYKFTGNWSGGEGKYGQMGIYAGYGNNLPNLAYFLSMSLANPDILRPIHPDFWSKRGTLRDAMEVKPTVRRDFFKLIQRNIEGDPRLKRAFEAGDEIMQLLNPLS